MSVATSVDAILNFRRELNSVDEQIIVLLGRRYEICRAVGHYKREHDIPMMQPGRVAEVKERCARLAREHHVDAEFAVRLFAMIIDEACRMEDEIIEQTRTASSSSGG
jgi:chorismate mutase-like protein